MSTGFETRPEFTKNLAGESNDTHPPAGMRSASARTGGLTTAPMVSQPTTAVAAGAQAYHRGVIVAVDIGNTAAKAAIVEGSTVHESGRLDTSAADAEDLLDGLRVLAAWPDEPPTAVVAVSVVDRWTERLEWAAGELGLPLTVVAASHNPISTALLRPDKAGTHLLLATWAADSILGTPHIYDDLGTATTVDAVDRDGF